MRVTVDLDTHNILKVVWTIVKGIIICKRLPYKIRKTKKGWHICFRGLDIDEETMFRYRKMLGDDENRIRLDRLSEKRLKQVLFKEKVVYVYEYDSFGNFIGKVRIQ